MKICVLNDGAYRYAVADPTVAGGAERQQWLLSRALAARGWSVAVGVRHSLADGEQQTIDRVKFVGIGERHVLFSWPRFLAAERPDWWYWRGADHWWGPVVELAKCLRVKTIFSAAFDRDVLPRQALFLHPRLWPLYAWGLARTDHIFVQHHGQMAELTPRWRTKATILPNIVDPMPLTPHSARVPYIAWVAMLRQVKRPDLLIEIARQAPSLRFVVAGGTTTFMSPPGYGDFIVKALREVPNLEYRGAVAPAEAQRIIANAAVLLSTSDEEGFPNTFLQAWASGTPVVSLRLDPDACIKRKNLGAVSGSTERAVIDLHELMRAPQRRADIGLRARRYVAEAYSESAALAAFEQALLRRDAKQVALAS